MTNVRYVGLDVHKDAIVMSVAESGHAEPKHLATLPKDINKVLKQLKELSPDVSLLRVCYEARPTGFGLSRRLKKEDIDCIVVAASLVPQKAGVQIMLHAAQYEAFGERGCQSPDATQERNQGTHAPRSPTTSIHTARRIRPIERIRGSWLTICDRAI